MHFYEMDTEDPEAAFLAMPPAVKARLGRPGGTSGPGTPRLWIDYVNSFRRVDVGVDESAGG